MGLHKTSMVHGIGAYLEQRGLIGWASEKVASEVYEHIAGQLQGPEQLPAAGLDPVSAYKIAQVITDTHANLARQGFGGDRSLAMQKQAAASNDVETLAIMTAGGLMQKRADAMILRGGEHTNRAGESPDTLAQLDQMQRPQGQYLTGVGNTDMPDGPSTWSSQPHPIGHSNTVPVSNSINKSAGWLDNPVGRALQQPILAAGLTGQAAMANPTARNAILGGAGGAALGAGAGALASDDGDRLQGALLGGAGGAALGAGAGALAAHYNDPNMRIRQMLQEAKPGDLGVSKQGPDAMGTMFYDHTPIPTPESINAHYPTFTGGDSVYKGMHSVADTAQRGWDGAKGYAQRGWDGAKSIAQGTDGALAGGMGGAGALGGAAAGYLNSDDDDRLRNALIGGAGGAALGVGGAAALSHAQLPNSVNQFMARDDVKPWMINAGAGAAGLGAGAALGAGVGQATKESSDISALLRKIASGGSLTSSPKNTASDAAKHDELAALDLKNRAEGKYVGVAGHSSFPNVNQDFHVQHMPGAPKTGPSTVSSREIKSASDLSYDEQLMFAMFNKTASEVAPYLPGNMPEHIKIAHVRAMMGLDNAERVSYINSLYGQR